MRNFGSSGGFPFGRPRWLAMTTAVVLALAVLLS